MNKRQIVTGFQRHVLNPLVKHLAGRIPGYVLLETTGRRTGQPVRNPVGGRVERCVLWIVAEHGRQASYVRNLAANPRLRVRVNGRWRSGTAEILDSEPPKLRGINGALVRLVGTSLLSIRIDLED